MDDLFEVRISWGGEGSGEVGFIATRCPTGHTT